MCELSIVLGLFLLVLSLFIYSTTVPRRAGELARKRVLAEPPPTIVRRATERIERLVPAAGGVGVVVAAAAVVAELRRPIEGSRLRRPREVVEVRGGAAGVAVAPCCSEEEAAIVRLLPTVRGEAADDDEEDGRVGVRGGGEEVEVARLLREGLAARREDDDAFRLGVVSCARAREPPVEREVELDERWLLPLLAPERDVVEALLVAWRVFGDVDNVAAPSPSCCSVEDSSVSSGTRRGEVIV